jgi:hypothetical protein
MKALNKLFTYLIIFQLCFACNGGGGSGGSVVSTGPSESVNFSGSLAKAMNTFTELLIDSAMAQGQLEVSDITTGVPKSLGTYEIGDENQPFKFDLSVASVAGKLIKVHFTGIEGSMMKERVTIINVEIGQKYVDLAMVNEDETIAAKIIESEMIKVKSTSKIKLRAKEFIENKRIIKDMIFDTGINLHYLLKVMQKDSKSEISSALASAFVAIVDNNVDSKKKVGSISSIADNMETEIYNGPSLICDDSVATFYSSEKEGKFKVTAVALSSELINDYGQGDIDVGYASNVDEANKMLSGVIERFNEFSSKIASEQSFALYVSNGVDFKAACKLSSKASSVSDLKPFDVAPIDSFTPVKGEDFGDIISRLYETYENVIDQGAAYVQQQADQGELTEYAAKKALFIQTRDAIQALNTQWDILDQSHNTSEFTIDVSKMSALSCNVYKTQEDFSQALSDATQYTHETYIEKYGKGPDDMTLDYWVHYYRFKYLNSYLNQACQMYFDLISPEAETTETVNSDEESDVRSVDEAATKKSAEKKRMREAVIE